MSGVRPHLARPHSAARESHAAWFVALSSASILSFKCSGAVQAPPERVFP